MNDLELRLAKLETQMQKKTDRINLLSELIYQHEQHQALNLHLVIPLLASTADLSPLVRLLSQQLEQYRTIQQELAQDDSVGREYVQSLIDCLQQTQQTIAERL
ncbi:hypothetical protein [Testudinibacter aquarius]|uniref:Uncharacterized protein n=1 Tax=Testudinibacter aquarius TaxID=1524974 RepID=A0A4R3Y8I4_9PAST|nr:hypothetical protein [Testudinibacter aquarius]KAE9526045.1 hypothetical protein A1D24_03165 [Testudinibacter aquarius]TCV87238.1 hypothetical protein EDC16_105157 [Testudinibacter aquarius]TNG91280.1 hypothetical protein FHQ21_08245 [Testudinibacter aquarius]